MKGSQPRKSLLVMAAFPPIIISEHMPFEGQIVIKQICEQEVINMKAKWSLLPRDPSLLGTSNYMAPEYLPAFKVKGLQAKWGLVDSSKDS